MRSTNHWVRRSWPASLWLDWDFWLPVGSPLSLPSRRPGPVWPTLPHRRFRAHWLSKSQDAVGWCWWAVLSVVILNNTGQSSQVPPDRDGLGQLLRTARRIAVVGLSRK